VSENRGIGVDALAALHEITAKIVASLDLDQTLATIARAMTEILDADIGAIYLLDKEAGLLRLRGIYGQRSAAWEGHTMSVDRGMNAMAIRTGQIQRMDDYQRFPSELRAQTTVVEDEPFGSVITAPMICRGDRLGSMGAVRRAVRPFSDRELVLFEMLADHASIAVANAITYEELEAAQARETAQLREHAERMAALDKAKSEFLQLASHELRSPIGVLRGYLSLLQDGSVATDDLPRILPILMAKTQQMNLVINEMLETARLEAGPIDLARRVVDLREVVRQSVEKMQPVAGASPIQLELPEHEVRASVDAARLDTVIMNLLDNALKYSGEKPHVTCALGVDDQYAEIQVRDEGIGIHTEDIPRLFERFSRIATEATHAIPGTGLGLYIARQLVRQHGGDITVSSRPGAGSVFKVTLPLDGGAR
jgi:signal transduction histidine kinase